MPEWEKWGYHITEGNPDGNNRNNRMKTMGDALNHLSKEERELFLVKHYGSNSNMHWHKLYFKRRLID